MFVVALISILFLLLFVVGDDDVVGVNCCCEPAKSFGCWCYFFRLVVFHVSLALATTNEIGKQGNHGRVDDDDDEYSSSMMERNR